MCSRIWRENENLALPPSFPPFFFNCPHKQIICWTLQGKTKRSPVLTVEVLSLTAVAVLRGFWIWLITAEHKFKSAAETRVSPAYHHSNFLIMPTDKTTSRAVETQRSWAPTHPARTTSATAPFWLWSPALIGSVCRNIKLIRASSVSLPRLRSPSLMRSPSARQLTRRLAGRRGACPSQSIQGGERTSATPPLIDSSQVMESESERRTSMSASEWEAKCAEYCSRKWGKFK